MLPSIPTESSISTGKLRKQNIHKRIGMNKSYDNRITPLIINIENKSRSTKDPQPMTTDNPPEMTYKQNCRDHPKREKSHDLYIRENNKKQILDRESSRHKFIPMKEIKSTYFKDEIEKRFKVLEEDETIDPYYYIRQNMKEYKEKHKQKHLYELLENKTSPQYKIKVVNVRRNERTASLQRSSIGIGIGSQGIKESPIKLEICDKEEIPSNTFFPNNIYKKADLKKANTHILLPTQSLINYSSENPKDLGREEKDVVENKLPKIQNRGKVNIYRNNIQRNNSGIYSNGERNHHKLKPYSSLLELSDFNLDPTPKYKKAKDQLLNLSSHGGTLITDHSTVSLSPFKSSNFGIGDPIVRINSPASHKPFHLVKIERKKPKVVSHFKYLCEFDPQVSKAGILKLTPQGITVFLIKRYGNKLGHKITEALNINQLNATFWIFNEYINFCEQLIQSSYSTKLEITFQLFDWNNDGKINSFDLFMLMKEVDEQLYSSLFATDICKIGKYLSLTSQKLKILDGSPDTKLRGYKRRATVLNIPIGRSFSPRRKDSIISPSSPNSPPRTGAEDQTKDYLVLEDLRQIHDHFGVGNILLDIMQYLSTYNINKQIHQKKTLTKRTKDVLDTAFLQKIQKHHKKLNPSLIQYMANKFRGLCKHQELPLQHITLKKSQFMKHFSNILGIKYDFAVESLFELAASSHSMYAIGQKIGFKEFLSCLAPILIANPIDILLNQWAFDIYDKNNNGVIDGMDICQMFDKPPSHSLLEEEINLMSSEYCKNHIYESVEKLKKAITLKKFNEIIPASYLPIVVKRAICGEYEETREHLKRPDPRKSFLGGSPRRDWVEKEIDINHMEEFEELELNREISIERKISVDVGSRRIDVMASGDTCLLCCNKLTRVAVGKCNHSHICMLCALRLRWIMKDILCPICKDEMNTIYIVPQPIPTYDHCQTNKFMFLKSSKDDVYFANQMMANEMRKMQENICPICTRASREYQSYQLLAKHLQQEHRQFFCETCIIHRLAFLGEQKLYTEKSLRRHRAHGDFGESQVTILAHPFCTFCKKETFNEEHLLKHLSKQHENCHLCKDDIEDMKYHFFPDFASLKRHFLATHYSCLQPECLEKCFVVFRSIEELHAHNFSEHMSHSKKKGGVKFPVSFNKDPLDRQKKKYNKDGEGRNFAYYFSREYLEPLQAKLHHDKELEKFYKEESKYEEERTDYKQRPPQEEIKVEKFEKKEPERSDKKWSKKEERHEINEEMDSLPHPKTKIKYIKKEDAISKRKPREKDMSPPTESSGIRKEKKYIEREQNRDRPIEYSGYMQNTNPKKNSDDLMFEELKVTHSGPKDRLQIKRIAADVPVIKLPYSQRIVNFYNGFKALLLLHIDCNPTIKDSVYTVNKEQIFQMTRIIQKLNADKISKCEFLMNFSVPIPAKKYVAMIIEHYNGDIKELGSLSPLDFKTLLIINKYFTLAYKKIENKYYLEDVEEIETNLLREFIQPELVPEPAKIVKPIYKPQKKVETFITKTLNVADKNEFPSLENMNITEKGGLEKTNVWSGEKHIEEAHTGYYEESANKKSKNRVIKSLPEGPDAISGNVGKWKRKQKKSTKPKKIQNVISNDFAADFPDLPVEQKLAVSLEPVELLEANLDYEEVHPGKEKEFSENHPKERKGKKGKKKQMVVLEGGFY